MLQTITQNGKITWECTDCKKMLDASISEAEYRLLPGCESGGMIALPMCSCGNQCFLKADYTLADLASTIHPIVDEQGSARGCAMPLKHVRNLLAQHMLHRLHGCYAPVLPMPQEAFLDHPAMGKLTATPDVAYSLWFAWALMREIGQSLPSFDQFLLGMTQPALPSPKEETNAA